MQRDPGRLEASFDVLVVGAGVYGAAVAWDAAQRGLAVALVDRGDFGGGTSFNNAKTVHGGVRSLQRGHLAELRQYVRERRALIRIAPHLVQPLPFLVPTRGRLTRGRAAMALYFDLYDLLSADRNEGVPPSRRLPASHLVSRDACLRAHKAIGEDAAVTGGALWYDGQLLSGERVTLAFVKSAARAGAVVANHVALDRFLLHGRRIEGAVLRDTLTGRELEARARVVVNATGPWADDVARLAMADRPPPLFDALSLALNVIVPPFESRVAVGGLARGRLFFLAPWRHVTVAGTSHDPLPGPRHEAQVTAARVAALLDDLNAAFPGASLRLDAVRLVHRGLLPSHAPRGGEVRLVKESILRDHRQDGCHGLLSVVGTRYTTARGTAEHAVRLIFELLGSPAPPCRTATTPLAGGDTGDPEVFADEAAAAASEIADPAARRRLARLYGTEWPEVEALVVEQPALARPLADSSSTLGAEIVHAARSEMAMTLADAVLRRSDAGSAGHPGADALARAADLMGSALGWSAEHTRAQIAEVDAVYAIPDR